MTGSARWPGDSGYPALRPSSPPAAVPNRSRRFGRDRYRPIGRIANWHSRRLPRSGRVHRCGGCSKRQRNATVGSFALCHQLRGDGIAWPGNWRAGEKCAGESVAG